MRKIWVSIFSISCLAFLICLPVSAEKVVSENTLNQDVYDGYAVDDGTKGDIIKYSNAYSNDLLEVLTYVYEITDKEPWAGALVQANFPEDTADAQIVGLRRKHVLILYTDSEGNRTYANYNLKRNELKLKALHVAQTNETCCFAKSKILSTINVDGKMTLQEYSMTFKASKTKKVSGLGIVYEINTPLGKHYCDQSGTIGVGTLNIRVIKP